jgi:hypothetical protein
MEVLQWFLLHFQQKSAHSYTLDKSILRRQLIVNGPFEPINAVD